MAGKCLRLRSPMKLTFDALTNRMWNSTQAAGSYHQITLLFINF